MSSYSSQYNRDENSLNINPGFIDPGSYNLNLQESSPCIDAGTLIPGLNLNYHGTWPDLGAIESQTIDNIVEQEQKNEFIVYPNPCSEYTQLFTEAINYYEKVSIIIKSIDGRIVLQQPIHSSITNLSTSHLDTGVYLITIHQGNHRYTQKIIKN